MGAVRGREPGGLNGEHRGDGRDDGCFDRPAEKVRPTLLLVLLVLVLLVLVLLVLLLLLLLLTPTGPPKRTCCEKESTDCERSGNAECDMCKERRRLNFFQPLFEQRSARRNLGW